MQTSDQIRQAFAGITYPGDNCIVPRAPNSDYYPNMESGDIEAFFMGRKWSDINCQVLWDEYEGQASACLTFMIPAAFRYYLPAYMLFSLNDFEAADVSVDATVYHLTPWIDEFAGGGPDDDGRFGRNMRDLTDEQRRAIAAFLLAMQECHGNEFNQDSSPVLALKAYWAQFLPDEDKPLVGRVPGYVLTPKKH